MAGKAILVDEQAKSGAWLLNLKGDSPCESGMLAAQHEKTSEDDLSDYQLARV